MKLLSCLLCGGELDLIGSDGFKKLVKCQECDFQSSSAKKKEPEIVVIKRNKSL